MATEQTSEPSITGPSRRALRLTFEYVGDDVVLTRAERLEKRLPPSDPLLREGERAQQSGFWIELLDTDQRVVWRRVLEDPRSPTIEFPDGERPGALTRVAVEEPRGSFRVLAPDRADAGEVAIVASPLAPEVRPGRARLVARFDLRSGERIDTEPGSGSAQSSDEGQ